MDVERMREKGWNTGESNKTPEWSGKYNEVRKKRATTEKGRRSAAVEMNKKRVLGLRKMWGEE